jgi:hypothetical protein
MTRGAGDIDRALAAGLPRSVVGVLAAARRNWWTANERAVDASHPSQDVYWAGVDEALQHPLAPAFDEVFVAALRRERGISQPSAVRSPS